jgi:hypothetical protein
MSIKQFPGGIITQNPTAPTTSAAKGIWTLDQASNYAKQGIWPRSPGAPTIGTATQTGATTATVTYTAPSDLGTGTVTFTATSNPGGLTGTGASPITVTGLTTGTAYTFTVSASTPGGTGPASAASNSVTPVATVPGAPTIGTATATGATTATVVYTAPASNGGSVITSYTATSSPSGITGTLSQAGSGTITVSGLTGGTAYTFTVTATNAIGTSAASAASNSITTAYAIGQALGGGYFAGQISTSGNGVANFNLVIGPKASAENSSRKFKNANTVDYGIFSVINGPSNSASIDDAAHQAAQFCEGLSIGGYSDWYMPAVNELEVCYYNLKPTTASNNTSFGANDNSVPKRTSNYTAGTPAQTSASSFQNTNSEAFNYTDFDGFYWSSTGAASYGDARYVRFLDGASSSIGKNDYRRVRAIRRVAV